MYRTAGLVALLLGAALTYSLVFTTFDSPLRGWRFTAGGMEQVTIVCPPPWGILFGDALTEVEPAWQTDKCLRTARTLFVEGLVVSSAALSLFAWGFAQPPRRPIEVLPSLRRA